MARDTSDDTPIRSLTDLAERLASGSKPKEAWRIGTEHEKFGFYLADHTPVPYEGPKGVRALLEGMEGLLGWEPIIDRGLIIGLVDPTGGGAISLEPGGQFELSGAPLDNLHQTCKETYAHLAQVREIAEPLGIGFLGLGMSPKWTFAETPQMPKSRYDIMKNYMPKVGTRGLDMMFRTCTVQVNLDFSSEADMVRKMRASVALQPIATALFANSPFTEGKPNGRLSERSEIWRDTDNDRSGMIPFVFEEGFGFQRYVDWALDVPMYFVKRGDTYHDATDITFRQYLDGGFEDRIPGVVPSIGDWDNHLSTLFPEVRLKRFLEMRGADGGPWRRICALPAFWVGLLYDETALDAALDLVKDWTTDEMQDLRDRVPTTALATEFRGRTVHQIARDVVSIARGGLARRARLNSGGYDETQYLDPVMETLASGKTPAELMLDRYKGEWQGDIDRVFEAYAY
ncbi:Glutamate-cysteine ligase GshA [Hartmannibacter diazotrophicus]|uniref:Glutamate--cysteine ligase n=1 Tax=Hartmannibacter diazotrophicus TaxID=1482074 RepID=A0A2C9D4U8_9HYPH|nr:glutamate--cysteine ligase [Hartmannibacter diazotrophicus]SON54525.1 Glutamate-cysteine ligase GshA [Hartmannibacter diazotrophicus]